MEEHSDMVSKAGKLGIAVAFASLAALALAAAPVYAEQTRADDRSASAAAFERGGACVAAIEAAEKLRRVPLHLLHAIALVESGRWQSERDAIAPWPWTVMAEGKGRYYASKEEAVAAVRGLQEKGITNIDVGCMQINLYYHGDSFTSLEEAFDPVHNVAYGTAFLVSLREKAKSWTKAIKRYHSMDRDRQFAYRKRVMTAWDALKHGQPYGGKPTAVADKPNDAPAGAVTLLNATRWPPPSYNAQKRLQAAARARALSGIVSR